MADNNSTDQTKEVVLHKQRLSADLPIIYFTELKQGVHFARNSAAKKSTGDLLYFTDDDMIADAHLLDKIAAVFERDEKVGSATGKVLARWEQSPPDWVLKYCINGLLSLADYGDQPFTSDIDPGIWSCHQALRRTAFFASGGFNPENTMGKWIGDGETGLNIKIGALGYTFGYAPHAITYHIIPAYRTTQAYLNKRLKNQGNCDAYTEYRKDPAGSFSLLRGALANLLRAPRFLAKAMIQKRNGHETWRLTRAYAGYYLSKCVYNLQLIVDGPFRKMVLRNNWLEE